MHGLALIVTIVIGMETALGLVFDPRERDFPFAALTMAAVPFAAMTLLDRPKKGIRPHGGIDICRCVLGGGYLYGT